MGFLTVKKDVIYVYYKICVAQQTSPLQYVMNLLLFPAARTTKAHNSGFPIL